MRRARNGLLCSAFVLFSLPALAAQEEHQHDTGTAAQSLPRTPIPVPTDADRAAAVPPAGGHPAHDNHIHSYLLFDRLEARDGDSGTAVAWEAEGWVGTDLDRLRLRSGGERQGGETAAASVEVLYGRSIAPWWDLVAGLRHDFRPGEGRSSLAFGIQGLAPQFLEVQATAYVGDGQASARFKFEYAVLFTNRLILQPQLELAVHGRDEAQRGIAAGPATLEGGLRLRYEITRRFAPYAGLAYERALGDTADLRRGAGESVDALRWVAGVRMWF